MNEDFEREVVVYQNENVPVWTTINYGSINDIKTAGIDENGVDTINIGDASPITDMVKNAEAESQVAPLPMGTTIHKLPGMQKDGIVQNEFVFTPTQNSNVMAPRNYYLSTERVLEKLEGNINSALMTTATTSKLNSLTVFKVPYGAEFMVTESTGLTGDLSDVQKTAKSIDTSLNRLTEVAKKKTTSAELVPVLFKDNKLTTEFTNINNIINSGKYADHYREGLRSSFGKNESGQEAYKAVAINISGEGNNQTIFTQFDFIYDSFTYGNNPYYSPKLNQWAKDNADSIIHTLIANYYLQVQFKSTVGGYLTPISLGVWNEKKLSFYKDLNKKGIESKEPFYLYMTISPKASNGKEILPSIDREHIVPDLSYIYGLYTGIHSIVWSGMDSYGLGGSKSDVWDKSRDMMNNAIKNSQVALESMPNDSNKINTGYSSYSTNLITGLSTGKDSGTYVNKEIVGALRVLLSKGENTSNSNTLKLYGTNYKIKDIGETKYSKAVEYSYMFKVFNTDTVKTSSRWIDMVTKANKVPIHPAIFRSPWENNSEHSYIMLPIMMGGIDFPYSLGETLSEMMKPVGSDEEFKNLSGANRYIIALNFKPNTSSISKNKLGTVEVSTSSPMGTAQDKSKPIILTGYNGKDSFSIVDYFKVSDYIDEKRDKSPISVKDTSGKEQTLKYFNLFKDFFTVKDDTMFIKEGTGKLKYASELDKESYKERYMANKSKSYINQLSPNYEGFFKYKVEETNTTTQP